MADVQIIEVLRGLPASGKTTYAKSRGKNFVRVSRDDIRAMVTGRAEKFAGDYKFEQMVTELEEQAIRAAIRAGKSVVVDDTNLKTKYAKRWIQLAHRLGVESDVVNFKEPLDVLLARNAKRLDAVPEKTIRDMYARHQWAPVLLPVLEEIQAAQYVPDTTKPTAITVDLDGTLAHMNGRSPYDPTLYHTDTVDSAIQTVVNDLWPNHQVIVFTGRSEEHREVCEQWLRDNDVLFDDLLMRPDGDDRQDGIVKAEIFQEHIAPNYNHIMHFDDRDRVVDALRAIGVKVAQVAPGQF